MSDEQLVDTAVLEELRELGLEDFCEVIDLFIEGAEKYMRSLHEALAREDLALFEKSAHTLKGSSGNIGATGIYALCTTLQDLAEAGRMEAAQSPLTQLDEEFPKVRDYLRRVQVQSK